MQIESSSSPLSEQVADYLGHLFESPRTQHTYETGLHAFQEFLQAQANLTRAEDPTAPTLALTLAAIDTNVLQDFQAWLGQKEIFSFFAQDVFGERRRVLNYALSKDWLPVTFSLERARAKLKQVTRRGAYPIPRPDPALPQLIRYYDEVEVPEGDDEKVRRKRLQTLRSRAFVHLLYSSAGRLAEVAALNRKDVGDGRRKEAIVTGKGDKERFIFITADARAAIAAYISQRKDAYEPLFISHGRDYGKRLSHVSLWTTIKPRRTN